MFNQPLFKDLNKRVSDLLTKDFPSEKQENKVEWRGTTPNNVSFETNFITKKDGAVIGTFTPKYKYAYNGWLSTFLVELNTKKELKGELAVEGTALTVPGLRTVFTAQNQNTDNFGTLGVEYKHELASVNVSADYGKVKGSTIKGGLVLGSKGFYFGASGEYLVGNQDDSDLMEIHTTVGYNQPEYDVSAFARLDGRGDEDKSEFGATYFHKVNPDLAVGAEVTMDTLNTETKPKLVFGSQYQWNLDSVVKGKFDTTGKLGISVAQRINKNAKLTFSSSIDTNNMSGKGASTFGFTLSLTD